MSGTLQNKKRIYYLDLLRVLAIISITANHAINRSFDNFHNQLGEYLTMSTGATVLKATITILSRLGVFTFLMISGALILNKKFENEGDIKHFYKHNWLSLLITSEIWFAIMYWEVKLLPGDGAATANLPHTFWGMIKTMLFTNQTTMSTMWYMNMLLCLYLLLPLYAVFVQKFSAKALFLPMGALLLTAFIVPNINALLAVFDSTKHIDFSLEAANLVSMYTIYVFAGYCQHQGMLKKVPSWMVWAVLVLTTVGSIAFQIYGYSLEKNFLFGNEYLGFLLISMCIFELGLRYGNKEFKCQKAINYGARITFGVYLAHLPIMELMDKFTSTAISNKWVEFLVLYIGGVGLSVLLVWLCSKNKYLKQYLFLVK